METKQESIERIDKERELRKERERYKASLVFSGFVVGNMSGVLLSLAGWFVWGLLAPSPPTPATSEVAWGPVRLGLLERRVERLEAVSDTVVERQLREMGIAPVGESTGVPLEQ